MSLPVIDFALDSAMEPSSRGVVVTRWMTLVVVGVSEGRQVVYRFSGTMAPVLCEELRAYRFNPKTAVSGSPAVENSASARGALEMGPGPRTHVSDTLVGGKPARTRLTLSDMSPAGGAWKCELFVGGGSWTVVGEGSYVKAQ